MPIFCDSLVASICGIVRIMLSTTCEDTTVWLAILSSTVGCILPCPKLSVKWYLPKKEFLILWLSKGSGKFYFIYYLLKFGRTSIWQKILPYQHYQAFCIQNQGKTINLSKDLIENLLNNGTKQMLTFDDSCEEAANSKQSVKFATARKHLGLNTIYIKHNFFRRSELG